MTVALIFTNPTRKIADKRLSGKLLLLLRGRDLVVDNLSGALDSHSLGLWVRLATSLGRSTIPKFQPPGE